MTTAKATKTKSGAARNALKDPKGGLTAAGRKYFKEKEGANLRPGVTKPQSQMTPEDMKRKGSFLRRHYATLRGPLQDENGAPTRLALQAQAWGERAPKTEADAAKLAEKGAKLLELYHASRNDGKAAQTSAKKSTTQKQTGQRAARSR